MRIARLFCLLLLLLSLVIIVPSGFIFAQEEEEVIEESITLETTYRKIEDSLPRADFSYDVGLNYKGNEPREFDLSAEGPEDWAIYIRPNIGDYIISTIRVEPNKSYPDRVRISATPPTITTPEPGEYKITFTASSGNLRGSIELTAVITATYSLDIYPTEQVWNTKAIAGKDSYFSITVANTGSNAIKDINFTSRKPSGWAIQFTPKEIASLAPGNYQEIDVNIKPDSKTIAGRYEVTLATQAEEIPEQSVKVWVDAEAPTVWGWIGIVIILLVIAGVTFIFLRFSRR